MANPQPDKGYVIFARNTLTESKTFNSLTLEQKAMMLILIVIANHTGKQWWDGYKKEFITVHRGQILTSLNKLKEVFGKGATIQKIRTLLKKLENMQFLTHQSTHLYSLITIANYDFYQTPTNYLTQHQHRSNKKYAISNTPINTPLYSPTTLANQGFQQTPFKQTTQQLTQHQHRSNTNLTTNNNVKNVKKEKEKEIYKEKEIKYAEYVSMKKSEYEALIEKLGSEEQTLKCIEILDNYKGASGKKYKSDYRAILTWVIKELKERQGNKAKHEQPNYWTETKASNRERKKELIKQLYKS